MWPCANLRLRTLGFYQFLRGVCQGASPYKPLQRPVPSSSCLQLPFPPFFLSHMRLSLILSAAAFASAYPLHNATVDEYDTLSSSLGKRVIQHGGCNGVPMRPQSFTASKCWTKRGNEIPKKTPDPTKLPPGTVIKPKPNPAKGWVTAYWWDVKKKDTTAETDRARDSQVHGVRPPADLAAPYHFPERQADVNAHYTCEHIMELQIIGHVLEDEGVCQMAKEMTDQAAAKKAIEAIRGVANTDENWVYFINGPAALKGKATEDFCAKSTDAVKNTNAGLQKRPAESTYTDLEWLAMQNYLDKTESMSIQTAERVDNKIHELFPHAPRGKVAEKWKAYLEKVKLITAEVKEKVDNEIECAKAAKAAADSKTSPGSASGRSSPTHPLLRRILSALPDRVVDFFDRRVVPKPKKTTKKQPLSCPVPPRRKPTAGTTPGHAPKTLPTTHPKSTTKGQPKTSTKAKPKTTTTKPKPKTTRPRPTKPKSTRPKVTRPKASKPVPKKAPLPAKKTKSRLRG
ncbi:hypothetical protein EXIGLDRAFT_841558 [Exidia glandulosa HHB12029]|uniref:Uncharacterized protein n=1 Tax=Exidia glandulosa HHB12029 TaxID=1314781 RepID=A0A165DTF5_EXIGL|nr:hypothetical protein EXIGLDRAFT_841558 [Exidia glandulosa HHB12029]